MAFAQDSGAMMPNDHHDEKGRFAPAQSAVAKNIKPKNIVRFTVAPAEGNPGKWVARTFTARKVEGHSFGTFGIKPKLLGVTKSKEAAQALCDAEKKRLTKGP